MIKNYLKDENAIDDALIIKIILIAIAVAAVVAIAWVGWNIMNQQSENTQNTLDNSNKNPGSGSEFSGGPFGK